MFRRILTSLLLFLSASTVMHASYLFHHYGVESGLSQSTVFSIIQDHIGFIWFGTKSGLNRFDGTTFKVYRASSSGGRELGNSFVTKLYEDHRGKIWVGTSTGVWIYDPQSDSFDKFTMRSQTGTRVTNYINIITEYRGKIYIASNEQGLFIYDPSLHVMRQYRLKDYPNIAALGFTQDDHLLLGFYGGGLYVATITMSQLTPFVISDGSQPFAGDIVSSIVNDNNGRVYIGSEKRGLSVIDIFYRTFNSIKSDYLGKNLFVRDIAIKGNNVWAASEMGLFLYNSYTHALTHFMYNAADPFSLSDNPLYSLLIDRNGGLWAGSYFEGINYLPSVNIPFNRIVPQNNGNSLIGRRIREMAQDRQGNIWIGSEDGGLCRYNPASNTYLPIAESASFPNIHGLCVDGDRLWVGTFSYGLKVIDVKTARVVRTYQRGKGVYDLHDNTVFSICRSPRGELFFGTIRGLCKLRPDGNGFDYISSIPDVLINCVRFDRQGNLWVATQTNGVYIYLRYARQWVNLTVDNHSGLTTNMVLSFFEDHSGRMWVCTQGGGLFRYNAAKRRLEGVPVAGLDKGNTVFQIQEDRQHLLWCTTYDGLANYDPRRQVVRYYPNASLILDNQFNYSSSLMVSNGTLYFGSLNGIVSFNPGTLRRRASMPRLVATQLWVDGELVGSLSKDFSDYGNIVYTDHLTLPYTKHAFSLRVVPLQFTDAIPTGIEYRLKGFDNNWQPMRSDFIIAYSQLPAGHYTLCVRQKDGEGKWDPKEYQLDITVKAHPLLTVWAKLVYLLIIVVIAWRMYLMTRRRMERRRHHAIEALNREKDQDLYESKIKFFTHVAHEIRTPLTLIKSPLESIISSGSVKAPEVVEDLKIMQENTNRLTDLINQLLDFRKTEREGLRLNYEHCNINQLVNSVYERFTSVAKERHINMTLSFQSSKIEADVDRESFIKMVSNLINNAVKYCSSFISVVVSADNDAFTVEVRNDGNIVPMEMRQKIFEPFFRMESDQTRTGSGIGLALVKSLANLHGGNITMSDDTTMNVFQLTLPLHQDMPIDIDDKGETEEQDAEPVDAAGKTDPRPTLLLVEDNVQLRDYESRKLQKTYNILTASDGEKALDVLANHTVDIIVTDIMMEPMDGMELLRRVKHDSRFSFIPVVLLTAVSSDSAKMKGMEDGADAYIVKPFSMSFLADTISNLLCQREEAKKAYASSPFISADSVSISSTDRAFLNKLKDVMIRNLDNTEFNVDKLAEEMNMSRSSLNRKIRGTLNISTNNYIRIERLKAAAQMLSEGEKKINEVCWSVGFSDPSYFSKCFFQQFGVLPKDFINSSKGKKSVSS